MKKVMILLVAVFALGFAADAQKAIGIRGGYGSDGGADVSCQISMGTNRLELDLGCFSMQRGWGSYANLTAIYQWTGSIAGNFGWYAGAGANVGFWMDNEGIADDNRLGLGLDAQLGVDYQFNAVPLRVSLDARPQWDFIGEGNGFGWGVALGLRYCL